MTWIFFAIVVAAAALIGTSFALQRRMLKQKTKHPSDSIHSEGKEPQSAGIDLMGRPRPVFTVKLPPDGLTVRISTPTKYVADCFTAIGAALEHVHEGKHDLDDIEMLYRSMTQILSTNLDNTPITARMLRERLSPPDLVDFFAEYMSFLEGLIRAKN